MKVGDLVQMRSPSSNYNWRRGAGTGMGIVLKGTHRQERTARGVTVYWFDHPHPDANKQTVQDIVEEWLEVLA